MLDSRVMRSWILVLAACAGSPTTEAPNPQATNSSAPPPAQGSSTMPGPNVKQPGGTGVDQHGVLLRSKPDPNAPAPDPALLADDDANLLFFCGGLAGDPALQTKAWLQLGLVDAAGAPTPKMTEFIRANTAWSQTHTELIAPYATPAKAKAYLSDRLK